MIYSRPYITEISEMDFRKLNLSGFRDSTEHIEDSNGGYSQNSIRLVSINDIIDEYCRTIRQLDNYPKLMIVALHKDNSDYTFYDLGHSRESSESFCICSGVCDIVYRKDRRIIKYRPLNSRYIQKLNIPYKETESIYLIHLL